MCERVRQKLGHTINLLSELSAHQLELILICPEKLDWPGRLAGISEGAGWISKKNLDHFSSSFLSSKMVIQDSKI